MTAVVGGIIGLLVRQVYLASAFQADTGLPIAGQPVTAVLWAVALVTFVILCILSRGKHRNFDEKFSSAFYAARPFWFVVGAAGGVLLILAGVLDLMNFFSQRSSMGLLSVAATVNASGLIRLLLGVISLLAGAGIYFTALNTRKKGEYRGSWLPLPGFVCCLWVMACYQDWAKDPVLGHYVFRLLAVLFAMVACYAIATFAFGKGKVTLTLATSLTAAALGIMVLGDGLALADLAIQLGLVFYLLSMAGCLAVNDAKEPPIIPQGCAPADCQTCAGCPTVPTETQASTEAPTDNA